MFLIDLNFRGCQGRSNRSSIVHAVAYFACSVNDTACTVHSVLMTLRVFFIVLHSIAVLNMIFENFTVHAMSMTPHALCIWCQWHRMHCASGVNDTAWTVHAVSMTPHAFYKILITSRIRIYIRNGFSPLIRSPWRMFWWKKPRVENLVTLSLSREILTRVGE
jgi:hypothetical protein